MQALFDSAARYSQILETGKLKFGVPEEISDFNIVERLDGNATTDFGASDADLSSDTKPIGEAEMERFHSLLKSCWVAFDKAVGRAEGHELRKGPRGGGRDLERIVDHVLMADENYLKRIGWKVQKTKGEEVRMPLDQIRKQILEGLVAVASGELPSLGPRGGKRWTARFFVRRVAWHVIDHTWEIEDRIL
jgi:hypothetical protein